MRVTSEPSGRIEYRSRSPSRTEVKMMRSPVGEKVASASYPNDEVSCTTFDPSASAAKMSKLGYTAHTYPMEKSGGVGQARLKWCVDE